MDRILQAPTVEECCSMPQLLILEPVGVGFEACRTVQHHTENLARTKISMPFFSNSVEKTGGTLVGICCGFLFRGLGSIPSDVSTISCRLGQQGTRLADSPPPPPFSFFLWCCALRELCYLDFCFLVSNVEPTAEGTRQTKRNKETSRSTMDCLQ